MAKRNRGRNLLEFTEEITCAQHGYLLVAGIDEVGRGCLAGPVVSSAVIMPREKCPSWYRKVRDSKLLSPEQREFLSPCIHEAAVTIGTGATSPAEIDELGMTRAVHLSMKRALEQLSPVPEYALIDYLTIPDLSLPHKGVTDGDTLCFSIACASIVAKVYRDHLMVDLDQKYPGYGLAHNKGYGTEDHMAGLRKLGPSPIHRRLFQPVRNVAQLSFEDLRVRTGGSEKNET